MVNRPSIILADKTTGNLASNTGVAIMSLLDTLLVFSSRSGHTRYIGDWSSDVVLFRSDLYPGTGRTGWPVTDFQQLESLHGIRSGHGLDRPRVFLLRRRRPLAEDGFRVGRTGEGRTPATEVRGAGGCAGFHCHSNAQSLSGLLWQL